MSEPTSTASVSLRGILAALVSAVGLLLLIVAPGRSADWFAEGLGLAMLGVVLLAAGLALIVSTQRTLLYAVAILTTVVAAWLVVTRVSGYPFGPWSSVTPQMGPYEIIVLALSIISLTLAVAALIVGTDHLGSVGIRFDTLAPLAIVVVALPGFAVSRWADDGAHVMGSDHTHSHTVSMDSTMPGMDHSTMTTMTSDERWQFGQQLVAARTTALLYPTLADARAAGWVLVGGYVTGGGQMVIDPTINSRIEKFDAAAPQGLLYASSVDSAPIVGVQYNVWTGDGSTPSGFIGQDMLWHMHTGTCEITESFAIPYDESVTGKACSNVNGTLTNTVSWMLRAWVVPGWENPQGTLTHDNSLLP
jgi:hypothetical protein